MSMLNALVPAGSINPLPVNARKEAWNGKKFPDHFNSDMETKGRLVYRGPKKQEDLKTDVLKENDIYNLCGEKVVAGSLGSYVDLYV